MLKTRTFREEKAGSLSQQDFIQSHMQRVKEYFDRRTGELENEIRLLRGQLVDERQKSRTRDPSPGSSSTRKLQVRSAAKGFFAQCLEESEES